MDSNGDRDPDYVIQTLINDRFEDIAYYTRYNDNFTIREGVTIVWPGGVTTPPNDTPECGWEKELCNNDSGKLLPVARILILFPRSFSAFKMAASQGSIGGQKDFLGPLLGLN